MQAITSGARATLRSAPFESDSALKVRAFIDRCKSNVRIDTPGPPGRAHESVAGLKGTGWQAGGLTPTHNPALGEGYGL